MSPYITNPKREGLDKILDKLQREINSRKKRINEKTAVNMGGSETDIDGEINYIITRIIDRTYSAEQRYASFNRAIGVLECVKQEYLRRVVALYENKKCEESGDVYGQ